MSTTSCKVAAAATGRTCKHYRDGQCTSALALPLYGAHPSVGVCQVCEHYRGRPRGLGDVVEVAARLLGIKRAVKVVEHATGKQCGCQERRQALNEKFPSSANAGIDETPKES